MTNAGTMFMTPVGMTCGDIWNTFRIVARPSALQQYRHTDDFEDQPRPRCILHACSTGLYGSSLSDKWADAVYRAVLTLWVIMSHDVLGCLSMQFVPSLPLLLLPLPVFLPPEANVCPETLYFHVTL